MRAGDEKLAARIDDLLPQTQCGKCGYAGCLPYARAVADGAAEINRCPPGGAQTIERLAELLGREPIPLDPACGPAPAARIARIDEAVCIGCTKCIQACPVDAIVGAGKQMHTVVAALCTGCELCVPPCPVDCIDMRLRKGEPPGAEPRVDLAVAHAARARFRSRQARLARIAADGAQRRQAKQDQIQNAARGNAADKQALIRAAIERTRRKRARLHAGAEAERRGDR